MQRSEFADSVTKEGLPANLSVHATSIAIEQPVPEVSQPQASEQGHWDRKWQERLLPMMITVIALCFVFFLVFSTIQFNQLRSFAEQPYQAFPVNDDSALNSLIASTELGPIKEDLVRWRSLLALERQAWRYRYHALTTLSAFRIWTRYTAFVIGMILVCVGSVFTLGKLREPESRLAGESGSWKVSLATSSPGVLLSVLGVGLMLATLMTERQLDITDLPIYVGPTLNKDSTPAPRMPPVTDWSKTKGDSK